MVKAPGSWHQRCRFGSRWTGHYLEKVDVSGIGRRQLLRSDLSVWWGYEVRVIRQRSVITGQCWEVHSYSWVDRDHSRDCDGKGNWETSQTNSTDGEKKAHDCK